MAFEIFVLAGGVAAGCAIVLYVSRRGLLAYKRTDASSSATETVSEAQPEPAPKPAPAIYESVQPQVAPAQSGVPSTSIPSLSSARRTRMYKRRAPPRRPATLRQNIQTPAPATATPTPQTESESDKAGQ